MPTPSLPTDVERRIFVRRTLTYLGGAALLALLVQGLIACFVSRAEMVRLLGDVPLPLVQIAVFFGAARLARQWSDAGFSWRWQLLGLGTHAVVQGLVLAPVTILLLGAGSVWWLVALSLLALVLLSVGVESLRVLAFYRVDQSAEAALVLSAALIGPFCYGGELVGCAIRVRD